MSLTAVAGWDLISPRTATAPRTEPSEHDTKHIKNVKDQTCALYTTSLSVYLSNHLLYRTLSIYFYALSLAMRFSLLVALWDLFSFVGFSEGKGNERRESNSQRWCLLVGDALSPVGVRYDVRCDPSGHPPHLYKPPNLYISPMLIVGAM